MTFKSKWLALFLAALAMLLPVTARAQVVMGFYSHEFGNSFPHALFTLKGSPVGGGAAVDTNYGFTAKSISPAILMGSVIGVVEPAEAKYVRGSDLKFTVTLTDAQYGAVLALVAKWKAIPGKSYSLNKRNCVHFIGEAAQVIGLKVVFDPKLMKKPRSFLENIVRLNPGLR
jgi:hypothetical protein